ncbi:hypothetical protein ACIQKE_36595 [Streptomyces griseoviridis]
MRIANHHHAWTWPKPTRKPVVALVTVIVLTVVAAHLTGYGTTVLVTITLAALTVAVEEIVRAALKYWLRVA